MYGLGYDVGSSSIKAALVDIRTNRAVKIAQYPPTEMDIDSPHPGWAEQNPETWWAYLVEATKLLLEEQDRAIVDTISGIGISYQMHGLVLLDKIGQVLRPSIIWCDSRAVDTGDEAAKIIGEHTCYTHMLNVPGNFTGAKLKWVMENEPEIYARIDKIMLPGDYLNYRLTGEINTTPAALSEGILWDFEEDQPASVAFEALGIKDSMIPEVVDIFSVQGRVLEPVADELGIPAGIPVTYRAGDQPNNAMSLGALEPGDIAATGGTSGVVYGVMDQNIADPLSRINSFAHVNYTTDNRMTGALLCINGAGSLYRWIKSITGDQATSYESMETAALKIPFGADGLVILPFGNGAERMLENKDLGAQIVGIDLNRHDKPHIYRAALEGIAFAFVYGYRILQDLGVEIKKMKAGNDNLFQSAIFSKTVATLLNCEIELVETTGAIGAAKAVGFTLKHKDSLSDAMSGNKIEKVITPDLELKAELELTYDQWKKQLEQKLNK